MVMLVAGLAIVRGRASQKDELRQAQLALAAAPGALNGVLASPQALLAGAAAEPSEFPISRKLRGELAASMTLLNSHWKSVDARSLRAEAAQMDRGTARMMSLIGQHRLPEANVVSTFLGPAGERLKSAIVRSNAALSEEIASADRASFDATVGVVVVAGLLLLALMVGLARARRRRTGADIERRAHRDSERRLQALVEHGSDMITVVEPDTTIIYQAGAVESMLGYQPAELEGAKLSEWLDAEDLPILRELMAAEHTDSQELRLRHRDGRQRTCEVHVTNLLDNPVWNGFVLNIWDLSERKQLEERLRHQAFHDTLTGLPNRALVLDRAEQMLARARRGTSNVAALFVDLDGFKQVNDSFGHAAGDELLKVIAERLSGVVRKQDTVGRLGGDEFVILIEPSPNNVPPHLVAERLLVVLREPIELEQSNTLIATSASIGVSVSRGTSVDELLRDADVALYEAKRTGRGRYVQFETKMRTDADDRLTLEADLQQALEAKQFFLLYQPTFDLQDQRTVGVEALIRWLHPTRGVVSPDDFIPIAEETGLIVRIGRWVLDEACAQVAAWNRDGHDISMSVNVSARQLEEPGFESDVNRALVRNEIDPSLLTLEITETALMRDVDTATERLTSLKKLGVRIAIDDFGTGHSSLAYLRRFPVDALKIDRSFVSGLASSKAAAAIIHTLVQLGKTLEIQTLAEGIELPAQLEKLQREDCDLGQGFLFARPLDAHGIEEFLTSAKSKGTTLART